MASIEKRKSETGKLSYRAKVRLKGFPAQSATFKRLTDARAWAQQTEAAIRERRHFKTAEAKRHTFSDLVDRFVDNELSKRPKVAQMRSSQLRWWEQKLGPYTLADISPALIAEKRDWLVRHGRGHKGVISPATVNRYLAALSVAFSAAEKEWGWIESSPCRKVRKLREPQPRVRFLSEEERKRLLMACQESSNPYLYTIVVLALSTGARKSELLGLRWPNVDLVSGRITLHDTKNRERRSLPLRGHAKTLVEEIGRVRSIDTDLLFPSPRNHQKPINIRDPWIRALAKAGIKDFRFHDLRHSAASYLAMNGATPSEIAAVLGHKTLQMVKRYAHLSDEHTASVVESMNRKIFGE